MNRLKDFIEWQAFGVCAAIGEKMGIATSRIRMWFIYISFLTMGSPIIVYMVHGLLDEHKKIYSLCEKKSFEVPVNKSFY